MDAVSHIECGEKQLRDAIRIHFANGDPVTLHTVTAPLHTVLYDLVVRTHGGLSMVFPDQFMDRRSRKSWHAKVREYANFLKHADRIAFDRVTPNPALTEGMLFDACFMYHQLMRKSAPEVLGYIVWFISKHPGCFEEPFTPGETQLLDFARQFDHADREVFRAMTTIASAFWDPIGPAVENAFPPRSN